MKVGIIVHSHTGNTLSVAQKLKDALLAAGHSVNLEQVVAVNEDPSKTDFKLETIPDTSDYETLIFAAPVRAFSLSPIMKAYLAQVPSLQGKTIGCFVTQHFPYPWMGGSRSVKQMQKACKSNGVNVIVTGIVNWTHKKRESKIADVIEAMTRLCN